MKAIKLASVFAVSAVAAAVSSTTFAADQSPIVFKGTAGLKYQINDEKSGKSDASKSYGEVNIVGDTGLVYFKMDMEGSTAKEKDGKVELQNQGDTALNMDAIYIKQGALSFGDFDGSITDDAAFESGVEENNDAAKAKVGGGDLGIRYAVNDDLKVALENKEGTNKTTIAAFYSKDLGSLTLGVSGGVHFAGHGKKDNLINLGVKVPAGMATFSAFYGTGKVSELKVKNMGVGVDLALSTEVTASVQYYDQKGEASKDVDLKKKDITEASLFYKPGDLTYFVTTLSYGNDKENYSIVGVKASF